MLLLTHARWRSQVKKSISAPMGRAALTGSGASLPAANSQWTRQQPQSDEASDGVMSKKG